MSAPRPVCFPLHNREELTPSTRATPNSHSGDARFWFSGIEQRSPKLDRLGRSVASGGTTFSALRKRPPASPPAAASLPSGLQWFGLLTATFEKFVEEWALIRTGIDLGQHGHARFNPDFDPAWNSVFQYYTIAHSLSVSDNECLHNFAAKVLGHMGTLLAARERRSNDPTEEQIIESILSGHTIRAERNLLNFHPDDASSLDSCYLIGTFRIFLQLRRSAEFAPLHHRDASGGRSNDCYVGVSSTVLAEELSWLQDAWRRRCGGELEDPQLYRLVGRFDLARDLFKSDWNRWKLISRHKARVLQDTLSVFSAYDISSLCLPFGYPSILRNLSNLDMAALPGSDIYLLFHMIFLVHERIAEASATPPPSTAAAAILDRYLVVRDGSLLPAPENASADNANYELRPLNFVESTELGFGGFTDRRLSVPLAYYACLLAFSESNFHLAIKLAEDYRALREPTETVISLTSSQASDSAVTTSLSCMDHFGLFEPRRLALSQLLDIFLKLLSNEVPADNWRCVELCEVLSYLSIACEQRKIMQSFSLPTRASAMPSITHASVTDQYSRLRAWINRERGSSELLRSTLNVLSALWNLAYTSDYEIALSQLANCSLPKMFGLLALWGGSRLCQRGVGYCQCNLNQFNRAPSFGENGAGASADWPARLRLHLIQLLIEQMVGQVRDHADASRPRLRDSSLPSSSLVDLESADELDTFVRKFDYWLRELCNFGVQTEGLHIETWVKAHIYLGRWREVRKHHTRVRQGLSNATDFLYLYLTGQKEECLNYPGVTAWKGSRPLAWASLQIFEKLVDLHLHTSNGKAVVDLATQILIRYPHHVKAHFLCADYYLKQGQTHLTEKHYFAALAHLDNVSDHDRLYVKRNMVAKIIRAFLIDYDARLCLTEREADALRISCKVNLAHCDFIRRQFKNALCRLQELEVTKTIDIVMSAALRAYAYMQLGDSDAAFSLLNQLLGDTKNPNADFATCSEVYRLYVVWALCALALDELQVAHDIAQLLLSCVAEFEVSYTIALVNARLDGMVNNASLPAAAAALAAALDINTAAEEAEMAELCLCYSGQSSELVWAERLALYVDANYDFNDSDSASVDVRTRQRLITGFLPPACRLYWCAAVGFDIPAQLLIWRLVLDLATPSPASEPELLRQLIHLAQQRQQRPGGRYLLQLIASEDSSSYGGVAETAKFVRAVCSRYPEFRKLVGSLLREIEAGELIGYSACQLLPVKTLFLTNSDLLIYKRAILLYLVSMHNPREMIQLPPPRKQRLTPGGVGLKRRSGAPLQPAKINVGGLRVYEQRELTLGRIIGSGGFGHVYKAVTADGQKVAVKLFRGASAGSEILKEVRALGELDHPNLVKLLGVCLNPVATVSELCEFGTLGDLIYSKKIVLSRKQQLVLLYKIARTLTYVHSKRLIHRDIKPANILLSNADYEPKLCDFGLANRISIDCTHVSLGCNTNAQAGGSPRYMPPETFNVDNVVNEKVDVWSFACVCLEMVTKQAPFRELSDYHQVKKAVLGAKLAPYDRRAGVNAGLSPHLGELLNRCFGFQATERPSIQELERAFKNALGGQRLL